MWNAIVAFAIQHTPAAVTGAVISAVLLKSRDWIKKMLEEEISGLIVNVQNPKVLAIAIAVEDWIQSIVPVAGDQRYEMAAATITAAEPGLLPFQGLIVQVLTALGQGAAQAARDLEAQEKGKLPPAAA